MDHLRKMSLVNFKRLGSTKICIYLLIAETIVTSMFFSFYLHHYDNDIVTIVKAANTLILSDNEVTPSRDSLLSSEMNEIVKEEKIFYNFEKNTGGKSTAELEKAKGLEIIANTPKLTLLGNYVYAVAQLILE